MQPNIIVLQTSYYGYMACKEILNDMGLKEDKDFIMAESKPDLDWFVPDTRQVFITGSFGGSSEGVAEMVQAARDQNKELITVSFSLRDLEGPFDHHVEKDMNARVSFKGIVQKFLDGTLVRTDVKWEPPKEKGIFSI